METYSFFNSVESAPEDPILSLPILFAQDPRPDKINLGIGSYKSSEGKSILLRSVERAEEFVCKRKAPRDYLPIEGDPHFNSEMIKLVLGDHTAEMQIAAFQMVGGTEALRVGGEFLARHLSSLVFISDPSWSNHHLIFSHAGLMTETYPYYDSKKHAIDFTKMADSVSKMPPGSIILLQTACHNPAGASLKKEEWQKLCELLQKGRILPFFDNAYQGFGKSIEEDSYPCKLFLDQGMEMLIASSCSKNFGLYGERVGSLIFVSRHQSSLQTSKSQIKKIVRSFCSTPQIYGAAVVAEILSNASLRKDWIEEVNAMRDRVIEMRSALSSLLNAKSGKSFDFIREQEGFFSLLGITQEQVLQLRHKNGIYIPLNGRINIAGITQNNLEPLVNALLSL